MLRVMVVLKSNALFSSPCHKSTPTPPHFSIPSFSNTGLCRSSQAYATASVSWPIPVLRMSSALAGVSAALLTLWGWHYTKPGCTTTPFSVQLERGAYAPNGIQYEALQQRCHDARGHFDKGKGSGKGSVSHMYGLGWLGRLLQGAYMTHPIPRSRFKKCVHTRLKRRKPSTYNDTLS